MRLSPPLAGAEARPNTQGSAQNRDSGDPARKCQRGVIDEHADTDDGCPHPAGQQVDTLARGHPDQREKCADAELPRTRVGRKIG